EQVGEREPGVRRPLADPAVGDGLCVGAKTVVLLIELAELARGPEGVRVGIDRLGPGDAFRSGNMPAAEAAFLGIFRHVGLFPPELLGAPDIYQLTLLLEMGQHVLPERPDPGVVPLTHRDVALAVLSPI